LRLSNNFHGTSIEYQDLSHMETHDKIRAIPAGRHICRSNIGFAFSLFIAVFLVAGCATEEFRMLTRVEEHYPSASQCGKCHIDIYEEWKQSEHSKSYSNDAFRFATNNYSFQDCLGCHSPVSIHSSGIPDTRTAVRDEGVTCVSCHFKQGTLAGPIEPTATLVPHEISLEKEFFTTSALCGTCHQGTYEEWRQAQIEKKKTCQDCHMREVTRKVTQATGITSKILVSMEEVHQLKRHKFDYTKMDAPEEAVSFNIEWENEEEQFSAEIVVVNKLPHFVPTGDFGFRKGTLELIASSAEGTVVSRQSIELYKEIKTALTPEERRSFRFSLPNDTSRVEVKLLREGQDGTKQFVIGERTFVRDETD
jgi:hypothetical protein